MDIRTVTVIGANGAMGCNVSGIFASFGDATVYMVCRKLEAAQKARERAALSVRAEAISRNLIPKTYDDLDECIPLSDLVFESVSEDIQVKEEVYRMVLPFMASGTILCTGTSGLSINALSEYLRPDVRPYFLGVHMYNPPYSMTLCEAVPSRFTDTTILEAIKKYLRQVLHRKVVIVQDRPAFMGNKIGFHFINDALRHAEMYKDSGGIDYIDSILGPFTGRSMAPLVTSDFVGLDVHKAIVDNIHQNTRDYAHETFQMPEFAVNLIQVGKLGRKVGIGLYKAIDNPAGTKTVHVYDIASDAYRPKEQYIFSFSKQMVANLKYGNYAKAFNDLAHNHSLEANICIQFLIKYVFYGIMTANEIGEDIYSADDVMATGFNWIPPLAVIDAFGNVETFQTIAKERMPEDFFTLVDVEKTLADVPPSKYDFRPFLKAK